MTSADSQRVPFGPQKGAQAVQDLHDDIRAKWNKLSDFDVGALTGTDDLVKQVAHLYTLDREQVQNDVAALLGGRTI